jgi:hypothetical protein
MRPSQIPHRPPATTLVAAECMRGLSFMCGMLNGALCVNFVGYLCLKWFFEFVIEQCC